MHMADALVSPVVGGAFWIAGGALIGYSAKKISAESDSSRTPLMGVLGAFVFAAQMINFSIPATGSSGHIGGGLLLAALLGPCRAFITLTSVLTIQCLFFADGGVLALGCNIVNLGFFPAFVAYPFVFRVISGKAGSGKRRASASIAAAVAGALLGAFSVVVQTSLSGISELPFGPFLAAMLPVHLAIGIVEGLAVWAVLAFVARVEPALIAPAGTPQAPRPVVVVFALAALVLGGMAASIASKDPDGLEWSIARIAGSGMVGKVGSGIHNRVEALQNKLSFLPDYSFRPTEPESKHPAQEPRRPGPSATSDRGTGVAGVVGGTMALVVAYVAGRILRGMRPKPRATS